MDRERVLSQFLSVDDGRLVRRGFPRTSDWWRETLARYLRSDVRQLVLRVGRRGGKSSTLCRLAVAVALFGDWQIPAGDIGHVVFISARKDEALARLFSIAAILTALGVPFTPSGDYIELTGRPIRFLVLPCTAAAVRGPTAILVVADEVSSWRDADSGANPATEVLAAARPMLATTRGLLILSSSPRGLEDAHAKAFDLGDTDQQIVAHAPTWIANPTLTEDDTRDLEPDKRIWSREYAAIPQAGALSAFDYDAIDASMPTERPTFDRHGARIMVLDPSSGRKDAWTWGYCGYSGDGLRTRLVFDAVGGLEGRFFEQTSGDEIVDALAEQCRSRSVRNVHADQRESLMLSSAFGRRGLHYTVHDWTSGSKIEAVARVRRWFADGTILLPRHEKMRAELLAFEEKISPSGAFTFAARGNGHDDYVSLLLTAAMADIDHGMPVPRKPGEPHFAAYAFGGPRMVPDFNVGAQGRVTLGNKTEAQLLAVHGRDPRKPPSPYDW